MGFLCLCFPSLFPWVGQLGGFAFFLVWSAPCCLQVSFFCRSFLSPLSRSYSLHVAFALKIRLLFSYYHKPALPTPIFHTQTFSYKPQKNFKLSRTHKKTEIRETKKRSLTHLRLYPLHRPIDQFLRIRQQLRRTSLSHPCSCERLQIRSPLWDSLVVRYRGKDIVDVHYFLEFFVAVKFLWLCSFRWLDSWRELKKWS